MEAIQPRTTIHDSLNEEHHHLDFYSVHQFFPRVSLSMIISDYSRRRMVSFDRARAPPLSAEDENAG